MSAECNDCGADLYQTDKGEFFCNPCTQREIISVKELEIASLRQAATEDRRLREIAIKAIKHADRFLEIHTDKFPRHTDALRIIRNHLKEALKDLGEGN